MEYEWKLYDLLQAWPIQTSCMTLSLFHLLAQQTEIQRPRRRENPNVEEVWVSEEEPCRAKPSLPCPGLGHEWEHLVTKPFTGRSCVLQWPTFTALTNNHACSFTEVTRNWRLSPGGMWWAVNISGGRAHHRTVTRTLCIGTVSKGWSCSSDQLFLTCLIEFWWSHIPLSD